MKTSLLILAMMGLRIPTDMEGRVMTEIFEHSPVVECAPDESPPSTDPSAILDEPYSEADLQQVTDRLSDLGYLE